MSENQKLKFTDLNPFKDSPTTTRFVSNVSTPTYQFLYGTAPGLNGLQQTTVNIFISKLESKLRELSIVPGSPNSLERFVDFITRFQLILPGSAGESSVGTSQGPNDGRATSCINSTDETTPNSRPKLASTTGKRKPRRSAKGGENQTGNKGDKNA